MDTNYREKSQDVMSFRETVNGVTLSEQLHEGGSINELPRIENKMFALILYKAAFIIKRLQNKPKTMPLKFGMRI